MKENTQKRLNALSGLVTTMDARIRYIEQTENDELEIEKQIFLLMCFLRKELNNIHNGNTK